MTPIPLFVELCAGTAAVSLRLERDGARPPVSRMGSKTGYADCILGALDLWPGQRAERYLWAEADPGVRLLLAAYTDRRLAQAAAEVIRGWAGEEPRALWERLRAEGPVKAGAVADAVEVARWMRLVTANRLINVGPDFRNTGKGGTTFGGTDFCTPIEDLIGAAEGVGEVPGVVTGRADIDPPDRLPEGTRVMIDPPYVDTTKYAADFSRADVVTAARKWRAVGARVAVCEAEPIPELIEEGWGFVDIGHLRRGQKRTFSKQQREVLTLSEAPPRGWDQERRVGQAMSLFGGDR